MTLTRAASPLALPDARFGKSTPLLSPRMREFVTSSIHRVALTREEQKGGRACHRPTACGLPLSRAWAVFCLENNFNNVVKNNAHDDTGKQKNADGKYVLDQVLHVTNRSKQLLHTDL